MSVVEVGNRYRAAEGSAKVVLPARCARSRIGLMRVQILIRQAIESTP